MMPTKLSSIAILSLIPDRIGLLAGIPRHPNQRFADQQHGSEKTGLNRISLNEFLIAQLLAIEHQLGRMRRRRLDSRLLTLSYLSYAENGNPIDGLIRGCRCSNRLVNWAQINCACSGHKTERYDQQRRNTVLREPWGASLYSDCTPYGFSLADFRIRIRKAVAAAVDCSRHQYA